MPVSLRDMSLARILAQGLVAATTAPTPVEAVRRQLAVQGQQVSAVPHALVARCAGAGGSDVEAAFEAGELVRSWPMRGTVHVTTAADHHWLRATLMHRSDAWTRRTEAELGMDEALCARAAQVALELLAEHGPLPRAVLLQAWGQAGLMGSAEERDVISYRRRHLLVRLQREGVLVQGPRRGNEHLVVDARSLPDADRGPAGADVRHGGAGHRAACAEIARRYALGHGPVSVADLARWTGLPRSQAAQALEDAVELTSSATYATDTASGQVPVARVDTALRPLPAVTGRRPAPGPCYARADLPDLLAAHRRSAQATLFLPSCDELHVGYQDRTCLTDAAGERLICPASNGMFRPLLVDRGRLVAVAPVAQGLTWLGGSPPSARVERDVARALERVRRRLAA